MAKYHISKRAFEDLTEIWNYTFDEWSEEQADSYYFLLLNSCEYLAKNPKRGKKYDVVMKNLLGYKSNQHIIFYLILSNNEIEIVRILHGNMDLKNRL
jgi:toxin ParE1/3/4